MTALTVLLTDSDLGDRSFERDLLHAAGDVEVVIADCRTEDDVVAEVRRHDPDAIVTQWAPIGARAFDAATRLKLVSRVGIGIDMIDLPTAHAAGVEVRNVPHYCTEEVATHAVALALALWRRLPQLDAEVRSGEWNAAAHAPEIGRLSGATVGLVGAGRIGALVGRAFAVWGARVIVVDPVPGDDGFERVEFDELARRSDIVSLHAPLLDSTRHLVGRDFLAAAERRPIIVNTSRGGLVDLDALTEAAHDGRVRGLGLDVFEEEPLAADHPIRTAPNTLLAPHAAWCSREALPDLRRGAVENVIDFFSLASGGSA